MSNNRFQVIENPVMQQYQLLDHEFDDRQIGEEDFVDVVADTGIERVLIHTGISDQYSGQGLASFIAKSAVDDIIAKGYKIVPVCPYVSSWLPKHPEYAQYVVSPTASHLRAVANHH